MLNTQSAVNAISASRIDRADERAQVASRREGHKRSVNNTVGTSCGDWQEIPLTWTTPCGKRATNGKWLMCLDVECKKCGGSGLMDKPLVTMRFVPCADTECHKCSGTGIAKERLAISLRVAPKTLNVRVSDPNENSYRAWRAQGMPPHPVFAPVWWRKYAYTAHGIRIAPALLALSPMPMGCRA